MAKAKKAKGKAERRQTTTTRRLAGVGYCVDPRTAAGKREFAVVGIGASLRIDRQHFARCFKRTADRSAVRQRAWDMIDAACDQAGVGAIAPQKFQKGVDRSPIGSPTLPVVRLDALKWLAELRQEVGGLFYLLLVRIIYEGQTYGEVKGLIEGEADERTASVAFRMALDEAARWMGLSKTVRIEELLGATR